MALRSPLFQLAHPKCINGIKDYYFSKEYPWFNCLFPGRILWDYIIYIIYILWDIMRLYMRARSSWMVYRNPHFGCMFGFPYMTNVFSYIQWRTFFRSVLYCLTYTHYFFATFLNSVLHVPPKKKRRHTFRTSCFSILSTGFYGLFIQGDRL